MGLENSVIRNRTFNFACAIVRFTTVLKEERHYEIARQLLRSGTSIGANVREAQRGVSTKDFKNKLGISLKEADETEYWLQLIDLEIKEVPKELLKEVDEIMRMLVTIIKNS
ncbi:four helix bundle protein [Nonlabens sp.]|uniref:four helix bundle protein n=1 Tax=Nonlabens sp. TaxID=1888209 RepID=UPI003263D448